MTSPVIMEENVKYLKSGVKVITKHDIKQKLQLAPKFVLGGQELVFDVDEPEEESFFFLKAKAELRETPEIVAQGLKELKELIAGEPDLCVPDDDDYFAAFLRPCKWYARSAFSLMKCYYRFRKNYPNIYTDLLPSEEKKAFFFELIYPSPLRTKDGCRLIIIEAGKKWKPKEVSLEQIFKGVVMCLQAAVAEPKTQISGAHVIIDMEGLSLHQVTYYTPSFAKMVTDFVQKSLPVRLKSVNIVNQSFLFNMVFAFFKPFLEEKFRKRIHFHGKNWDALRAIVDRSALFKKYGGDVELSEELFGEKLWQLFCCFDEFFEFSLHLGYNTEKNRK